MDEKLKLRWMRPRLGFREYHEAYLGRILIAQITVVPSARAAGKPHVRYHLIGVVTKHMSKSYGEVRSISAARGAIERAWRVWLGEAGLVAA